MPISVLNSGHGGTDSGAVANGLTERDINFKVATIAKELMEFNGITVPPIISGANLSEVIRQVNKIKGANLCHSIHHNAGKGDGSETIHSVHFGQATIFAKILQEEFDKLGQNRHGDGFVTKLSSDGIHDYYGFIRYTDPPAVISEYCFIDSDDYKSIDTYEEQYAEAEAIAKAHCRFYGIEFKSPKQSKEEVKIMKNLVTYKYEADLHASFYLSSYLQCIYISYDLLTQEIIDNCENIYQVGGVKLNDKFNIISGEDRYDTLVAVLKYIGKLK